MFPKVIEIKGGIEGIRAPEIAALGKKFVKRVEAGYNFPT